MQGKGKWKLWADDLTNCPPIPRDVPVNQIIVPTVETIRCTTLMAMLSTHMKPLMLIGPTGTGKSVYTSVSFLCNSLFFPFFHQISLFLFELFLIFVRIFF